MSLLRYAALAFATVCLCPSAQAGDQVWTGAVDANWGSNANWVGGRPSANDNAVFSSSFTTQPTLNFNAFAGGIWMTNGVGQNVSFNGIGTLSLAAGVINGTGALGILVDNASAYALTINAPLAIAANQTWRNNSANVLTVGAVHLSSNTLTVDGSGTTAINGVITGGGSLMKNGAGTLILSGPNTHAGTVTVLAGALNIRNAGALGSTLTAGTSVLNGAALQLQGGIVFNPEALALLGSGIGGTGALRNMSGNNTFTGPISLGAASTIGSDADLLTISGSVAMSAYAATFTGAGSTQVSGVISGTGSVMKNGDGT